jgi:hypothetical protein
VSKEKTDIFDIDLAVQCDEMDQRLTLQPFSRRSYKNLYANIRCCIISNMVSAVGLSRLPRTNRIEQPSLPGLFSSAIVSSQESVRGLSEIRRNDKTHGGAVAIGERRALPSGYLPDKTALADKARTF